MLDTIRSKPEAEFTTRFLNWARKHMKEPAVFEVKHTHGLDTFYIMRLQKHQRHALRSAKHGAFTHKLRDSGYLQPFDAILFTRMEAYLVIKYPKFFAVVDIDRIPAEGTIKSDQVKRIAAHIVSR